MSSGSQRRLVRRPSRRTKGPKVLPARVIKSVSPHGTLSEFAEGDAPLFLALFTIHHDGSADVEMVQSTGHAGLDALALDAARRWTFAPATCDGVPVQSYLRLQIEFVPMFN